MNFEKPNIGYHKNNEIRIFHSFAEASTKEIEYIMRQSPLQRMENAVELILRTYGTTREKLQGRTTDKTIKIIVQT